MLIGTGLLILLPGVVSVAIVFKSSNIHMSKRDASAVKIRTDISISVIEAALNNINK